ncbi:hypothetical protein BDW71DRAFT_205059 [Aspergillus fruticulosus]
MAEQSLDVPESSNGSNAASPRSSIDSRPPSTGGRTPRLSHASNHQHRQSFSESLRAAPGSPRARRQPSLTQAAIQSLIDNPPAPHNVNPAFAGRDWREISIGELVSPDDLKFVEVDTGIEEATNILIDTDAPVLLIRETPEHKTAVGTFDYSDLNTYLLLAAGLTRPDEDLLPAYEELARKAHENIPIPMRDVKELGRKEPLTTLPASASLMMAVETFGGGVHRVVVIDEQREEEVIGIVSQFRLVKFLWENGRCFPVLDQLYPQSLRDLKIGSHRVISINGDKMLSEALQLMHSEGISSVAVVDNHFNVVGNISTTDVKLLTRSSSLPLLSNTCTHFISVILSTRGIQEGKDSFPVFHVNPGSTLAHTVAKVMGHRSVLTVVIRSSHSVALNGARATSSDRKHQRTVAAPIPQRTRDPCAAGGSIRGRSICESGTSNAVDSSFCSTGGSAVGAPCGRGEPDRCFKPARASQRTKPGGSSRESH